MKWRGRRQSSNIGRAGGGIAAGGGIIGIIIYVIYMFMGGDGAQVNMGGQQPMTQEEIAADDTLSQFVAVVLAETEDIWHEQFAKHGATYSEPQLILFTGAVQSACGHAGSASGPFYCPADQKIYIDLSFYSELRNRFGAPGDFAMAYVVAHEVGHHVQHLMGTTEKMAQLRQQVSEGEYNKYSVMLELQADFYAGVWAHYAHRSKNILDEGDIQEALNAANAIGDDNLQRQSQGHVVPESFTHGTSQQRMYWFKKGFETGDLRQGNTFSDPSLRQGL